MADKLPQRKTSQKTSFQASAKFDPSNLAIEPKNITIVVSTYNDEYTGALCDHAVAYLNKYCPTAKVATLPVPGAFEIPIATKKATLSNPDFILTFGVIIQGATAHADLIAQSVTQQLHQLSLDTMIPVIHEVLLVNDVQQAHERCLGSLNRGEEAAAAGLMIHQTLATLQS